LYTKLDLKNATYTSKEIIIKRKKENIIIPLKKIKNLFYARPTFWNYIFLTAGSTKITGFLYIECKEKINKRVMYMLKIKYNDVLKLPKEILSIIELDRIF
jgi:hypothetical protein